MLLLHQIVPGKPDLSRAFTSYRLPESSSGVFYLSWSMFKSCRPLSPANHLLRSLSSSGRNFASSKVVPKPWSPLVSSLNYASFVLDLNPALACDVSTFCAVKAKSHCNRTMPMAANTGDYVSKKTISAQPSEIQAVGYTSSLAGRCSRARRAAIKRLFQSGSYPTSASKSIFSASMLLSNMEGHNNCEPHMLADSPWLGATPDVVKTLVADVVALGESEDGTFSKPAAQASRGIMFSLEDEDQRKAFYDAAADSEEKLRIFAAWQIAARLTGCTGYQCLECWLPLQDCICGAVSQYPLRSNIQFWVYMHPKEFMKKNNTGKLLYQILGERSARLCVYGIEEQEAIMWRDFEAAGETMVWCLYPERGPEDYKVPQLVVPPGRMPGSKDPEGIEAGPGVVRFVLLDGTWSNVKAMMKRLQARAGQAWDGRDMRCVSLSPEAPSVMHNLRPQPARDKTCTAASAAVLLRELGARREFEGQGLVEAADALDLALDTLLEALKVRRVRYGKPPTRLEYVNQNPNFR